ncbi:MAG: DUF4830 domain-containing protein [Candidatus Eremiobacteraeota bacterium]|nr:DUF4830 domain-containing protein [Candidatus Eremiobacteraeota bacterium]
MKAVFALLFILMTVPAWSQDDPCKALLDKWGWKVEAETGSGPLEIPKKLTGLPFYHYQAASREAGLDLSPFGGQEAKLRTFLLTERGAEYGAKIFAHIAVKDGRVIGAWLSTDAPVAPGIASLKSKDFPKHL